jgi:tetratricopeptide (TPR) repeat protein
MRRLNVKFAIILGVLLVASGIGIHLLHGSQVSKSAEGLPQRAEDLKNEGRYEEAYMALRRYTILAPDDPEGWDRLGDYLIEWLEKLAQTPDEWKRAFATVLEDLDTVVIQRPDKLEYRKKAAQIQFFAAQFWPTRINDARKHFQHLVEADPDDVESRVWLAICEYRSNEPTAQDKAIDDLYALVGFDARTQKFDAAKGKARDQLAAYQKLAEFLRQERTDNTMADAVLDAMVTANPENHRAYLMRGVAHLQMRRNDEAKADIDRALELDTKNEDLQTLLLAAEVSMQRQEFDRAEELLGIAERKFPKSANVYFGLMQLAQSRGRPDKALDYVLQGLAIKENKNNSVLLYQKAWLQAAEGDLAAARETAEAAEIAGGGVRGADGDLLQAFITLQERKYVDAAKQLEAVRPRLTRAFDVNRADLWLGRCYGELDKIDLQIGVYERMLGRQPNDVGYMLNLARAKGVIGKTDEAWELLKQVRKQFEEGEEGNEKFVATKAWGVYFEMAIHRELRKVGVESAVGLRGEIPRRAAATAGKVPTRHPASRRQTQGIADSARRLAGERRRRSDEAGEPRFEADERAVAGNREQGRRCAQGARRGRSAAAGWGRRSDSHTACEFDRAAARRQCAARSGQTGSQRREVGPPGAVARVGGVASEHRRDRRRDAIVAAGAGRRYERSADAGGDVRTVAEAGR